MYRILVIDDDTKIRQFVSTVLGLAGYDVIQAADGIEGMTAFDENQPDMVITDVVMPGKDGIEAVLELREKAPQVPVLVMTGGGQIPAETYLRMATGVGATRTLRKPFLKHELLQAIDEGLKECVRPLE